MALLVRTSTTNVWLVFCYRIAGSSQGICPIPLFSPPFLHALGRKAAQCREAQGRAGSIKPQLSCQGLKPSAPSNQKSRERPYRKQIRDVISELLDAPTSCEWVALMLNNNQPRVAKMENDQLSLPQTRFLFEHLGLLETPNLSSTIFLHWLQSWLVSQYISSSDMCESIQGVVGNQKDPIYHKSNISMSNISLSSLGSLKKKKKKLKTLPAAPKVSVFYICIEL